VTPPKKLTDTDENEAVRAPGVGDSSEHMRAIARDESRRNAKTVVLEHEADCPKARDLWDAVNELREGFAAMREERAEERGKNIEIAKNAAKSMTLRAAAISAVFSLAVGLTMFVLQRTWPPHAQASPAQVQTGGK